MKNQLVIIASLFVLSSCAPTYKYVNIAPNEKVTITRPINYLTDDSVAIASSFEVVKTLNSLDSLSNYLEVSGGDFCDFKYDSSSFHFESLKELECETVFEYGYPILLKWKFPRKIVDIQGQGDIELHRNNRELLILDKKDNYCSNEEKVDITVTFGEESAISKVNHPFGFRRTGVAMDILPGFGFGQINGDASNHLKAELFMNWGFSIVLNKTRLITRLALLDGRLNDELNGFNNYRNFENTSVEFGIGQELLDYTYLNFTPVVYAGANKLVFYNEDGDISENLIKTGGIKYAIGATVDLKVSQLFRKKERRQLMRNEVLYLKVDAGWYPDYFQQSIDMQGSVTYLTFAIGGYLIGDNDFRKVKFIDR